MWPFARKAPPAATKGPAPMPAPLTRTDWKFQPPVQRAIGEHPLTAPADAFAQQLATRQDPSVVSHTLGHHINIDAPAGLVLAIATPGTRQDGPAMISRPRVQRNANIGSSSNAQFSDGDQDTAAPQPVPGLPSRELPIVAGPPEVRRLTTMAPDASPAPVGPGRSVQFAPLEVHRSTQAASDDQVTEPAPAITDDSEPSIAPRRTLGQSRRLGLGAPLAQVPATSIQRATDLELARPRREPAESSAAEPAMATPSLEHLESPEAPDEPDRVVSGPMPAEAAFGPAVQRAVDMPLASPAFGHQEAPRTAQETAARTMDDGATTDNAESPSEVHAHGLELPLPTANAADPARTAGPTQPQAQSTSQTQRAIVPGGAGPADMPPRTVELPLLQRRLADSHAEGSALDARTQVRAIGPAVGPAAESSAANRTTVQAPHAGSRARGTFVQRAVPRGDVQAAKGTMAAAGVGLHQVVSPLSAAARLYRSPARDEASTPLATADHALAGKLPGQRGLITQRVADDSADSAGFAAEPLAIQSPLTLTQASQASSLMTTQASQSSPLSLPLAPLATMASLQRATASIQAAAFSPPMALQTAAAEQALPDRQETFFAQREVPSGSSPGGASTPGPAATADPAAQDEAMDALAGKLYDRIRSRLKSELLVDRERAGLLTDLR